MCVRVRLEDRGEMQREGKIDALSECGADPVCLGDI